MDAEDGHSIWQQIWRATYNAAAYRTVNKGVELAPEAIEGGRQLNGLLYNLLTECFFEAECVRIRRLVESGRDGLDKNGEPCTRWGRCCRICRSTRTL